MVEVLSQFGPWPAVVGILFASAVLIGAIGRLTEIVLTYRLGRRALKGKKSRKALRDLAKVIEAQRGEHRRRKKKKKNKKSKALSGDQPPVLPSGASS